MGIFWHMTCSGTLLIAAVLIFRSIACHKLPKRVFVLMWCMILARLLIPYSLPVNRIPGSSITGRLAASLLPEELGTSSPAAHLTEKLFQKIGAAPGEDSEAVAVKTLKGWQIQEKNEWNDEGQWPRLTQFFYNKDVQKALTAVWFAAGSVMAALILLNHIKWLKRYQTSLPAEGHLIEIWQKYHSGMRTIQIRHSDQITAPLTYGLLRPVILLPSDLCWENRTELLCILEHERLHIKYFDLCTKYAMCLALCAYWFHPLVWLMYVLLSRDLEAACDEEVLHRFRSVPKSDYALLLIKLANGRSGDGALGAGFSNYGEMKERITSIMKTKKYTLPAAFLAALMLLGMSCAFTASVKPKPDAELTVSQPSGLNLSQTEPSKPELPLSELSKSELSQAKGKPNTLIVEGIQTDSRQPQLQQAPNSLAESPQASFQDNGGTEPSAPVRGPEGVTGEQIAELAKLYVGSPYAYGGTDLETGVDSSGFIKAIFHQKGISLPHSSAELANVGIPVAEDQLLAGDLILYGTAEQDHSLSPTHSAIYLGDGNVIHAANVRVGVKISEIDYRKPYSAYRVIPAMNQ